MATPDSPRMGVRRPAVDPDHQLPPGRGEGGDGAARGTGLGALFRSLGEDIGVLVRQEIELAKAEAGQTAKRVAKDGLWIGSGAVIVAVGGICLVVAMALGLGVLLGSYWLGTLITGVVLVLLGGLVAWKGARDLGKGGFAPTGTVETVKEDVDWARREMRDFKNELTKES